MMAKTAKRRARKVRAQLEIDRTIVAERLGGSLVRAMAPQAQGMVGALKTRPGARVKPQKL